ncbi:MAG TPA: hypothetical protein DEA08_08385 [Planctomycetes bacterium]|nr:hypothetical protein [Planctomycetota bacterium]
MLFDLHSHTIVSDGILAPEPLVAAAARAGIDVFAITDHDTVGGVATALAAAAAQGVQLVPGIEISAHHGERELHLLAYFAPDQLGAWERFQAQRREARWERFRQILARLDELGASLDEAALTAERQAEGRVPGRPHVARALVEAGHVSDMEEAFRRYLGREAPAYVATRGPSAAEAIAFVREVPGVSVLAHPVYGDLDEVLEELTELGLDGVEAFHFSHDEDTAAHFSRRAGELGLLMTGGSDYHGDPEDPAGERAGERLGRVALPPAAAEAFCSALADRTGWAPKT